MSVEMKSLVIKEGSMVGFKEGEGFIYKLNGSYYLYKGGNMQVL